MSCINTWGSFPLNDFKQRQSISEIIITLMYAVTVNFHFYAFLSSLLVGLRKKGFFFPDMHPKITFSSSFTFFFLLDINLLSG